MAGTLGASSVKAANIATLLKREELDGHLRREIVYTPPMPCRIAFLTGLMSGQRRFHARFARCEEANAAVLTVSGPLRLKSYDGVPISVIHVEYGAFYAQKLQNLEKANAESLPQRVTNPNALAVGRWMAMAQHRTLPDLAGLSPATPVSHRC